VLFSGGALQASQAIARLSETAATHELRAKLIDIISRTVTAYLQLLRAQELKQVADRTVELAREQVKVATVSFEADAVPRVNVLRAEAALQNALQGQLKAGNGIELATASLNQVMGRSQLLPLRVAPLPRRLAEPPNLLDSLQRAVVQRPELRALQKGIEINREAVKAAEAGYWPTVSLQSQIDRSQGSGGFGTRDGFQVMGVFRLNLWDWGQTSGKVKSAGADVRVARYRLEQTMQGVELQVRRAVLNIGEARKRVEAAQAEVQAARQAYEIEQLRYTSGDGTYLELLDARRALSEAESNLVTSYYDNALAEADWLAATGSYFAASGQLTLPQGQQARPPAGYRSQGKELGDLMAEYGIDPKTEKPQTKGGAK